MKNEIIPTRFPATSLATLATHIAPMVLAMVLSVRIAELVNSISFLKVSRRLPCFGDSFFSASISEIVVLSMKASRREQKPETPRVKQIGNIRPVMSATESPLKGPSKIHCVRGYLNQYGQRHEIDKYIFEISICYSSN